MKKILIIMLSVFLLTACGEKKVDATSEENLKISVQQISQELNADEQKSFQKAITKMVFVSAMEAKDDKAKFHELLIKNLNGKTAKEVIKLAENGKPNLGN